jgi:hypothetical protein
MGVVMAAVLICVVGFMLNCKKAFRCLQGGCSGTMEPLGPRELDDYLEDAANPSTTPDDTTFMPAVPDVLMCDTCGECIERRG